MYLFRKKITLHLILSNNSKIIPYTVRIVYQIIYAFAVFLFFRKISYKSYVSPFCILKNKSKISLGKWSELRANTYLNGDIIISDYTQLNPGVVIYGKVKIGKYVMIGPNTMLAGGGHNFDDDTKPMMLQGSSIKFGGITIKDDVWIGANVSILDGVTIEKGIINAAGSVVTKSADIQNGIYAGIPAKYIKNRF